MNGAQNTNKTKQKQKHKNIYKSCLVSLHIILFLEVKI